MNLSILQTEKIKSKSKSKLKTIDIFLVILTTILIVFAIKFIPVLVLAIIAIGFVWFFSHNINYAIYPLILTGFFHGWVINFSTLPLLSQVPVISGIDAPLVDLVAITIYIALAVALVLNKITIKKIDFKQIMPGVWLYLGFFVTGLIAVKFFMFNDYTQIGYKYALRPILFMFMAYFILPFWLVKKNTHQYLNIIKTMFWLAFVIAIFGLSSVLFIKHMGFPRMVPYEIFGITPLGTNHNQLAEVLVALLPAGWYLYAHAKYKSRKENAAFYAGAALFITAIAALTLSRAAWVSMSVQAIIATFYLARFTWFKSFLHDKSAFIFILFLPVIAYMTYFLGSSIVTSSNVARIDAATIAFHYTAESPWVGQGPGSFIYILADTALFRSEYGDPLDSHGFMLKMLLEQGIIGLMLFVAFLVWVIGYVSNSFLHTKDRALVLMLLCSISGIITFQLFDTSYYSSIMWLPLGLAVGMVTGVRKFKF